MTSNSPALFGAFPRMLRRMARYAPQPYKTALKMAAEEIDELREYVEHSQTEAQLCEERMIARDTDAHSDLMAHGTASE